MSPLSLAEVRAAEQISSSRVSGGLPSNSCIVFNSSSSSSFSWGVFFFYFLISASLCSRAFTFPRPSFISLLCLHIYSLHFPAKICVPVSFTLPISSSKAIKLFIIIILGGEESCSLGPEYKRIFTPRC